VLTEHGMTLGRAQAQQYLFDDINAFCEATLAPDSIYALLHREREQLFPDELFADLYVEHGRRSVPPSVVATVMVLQRLGGYSDREAVEHYTFDARWRYAAGVGGYDGGGRQRFVHTVLVEMRERLRRSERPDRVFEVTLGAARAAGLVGRHRVLDSAPLYDAVTTMDTVTLVRSALRGLLRVADGELAEQLRAALTSGDDYTSAAKPQIDWDDAEARAALIDSRAQDALACLGVLEGRKLSAELTAAMQLLASVVGQDLEQDEDLRWRIARRVARERVISTVDREARHGHKTAARGFDGYKGHVAVDPESELITATAVTPGNVADASVAAELIGDLLPDAGEQGDTGAPVTRDQAAAEAEPIGEGAVVYGDQAYGTGAFQEQLSEAGITSRCKTQRPTAPGGRFPKDRFAIDLEAGAVTCPAGLTVPLQPRRSGERVARFGAACASCPRRADCTASARGRSIHVGVHEASLARARARQADPAWRADYRATRPKVERKLGHLLWRKHGGRHARVRGTERVDHDFRWLAAAVDLARLAVLGLHWRPTTGWSAA
jgi:hypothetical protein